MQIALRQFVSAHPLFIAAHSKEVEHAFRVGYNLSRSSSDKGSTICGRTRVWGDDLNQNRSRGMVRYSNRFRSGSCRDVCLLNVTLEAAWMTASVFSLRGSASAQRWHPPSDLLSTLNPAKRFLWPVGKTNWR